MCQSVLQCKRFDARIERRHSCVYIVQGMPAVNVLRLIRVFKMVRLFRKLTALRVLINALSSSVVPVLYSFVILILISSIYSVLATDLFRPQGEYNSETSFMFSTFSSSLFTLFQVAFVASLVSLTEKVCMRQTDRVRVRASLSARV